MRAANDPKYAIGVTVAAVVVLAAAFMPWGEIKATPTFNFGGAGFPLGNAPFGNMEMTLSVTGWNGNITLLGLKLPNWLVVLAAGAVALVSWLTSLSIWRSPAALPVAIAAYGLAHAAFAVVMLIGSEKGSVGIGSLLTVLAFAAMIVAAVQQYRMARPAALAV